MTTEEKEAQEIKGKLDLAWQQVHAFAELLENKGYDITLFGPKGKLCIQTEKVSSKAIKTIEVSL